MKTCGWLIFGGAIGIFLVEAVRHQEWSQAFHATYWFAAGTFCSYLQARRASTVGAPHSAD